MALAFILGASGSGKSHQLHEQIIRESMAHPDRNYMVIVPEQFTMQTQKSLVMAHPKRGIMNIDVLSFVRLAHRIFEELGGDQKTILDDVGKNLVLRRIAGKVEPELAVLKGNLKKVGYISEVKSVLSEFTQYDVHGEELDALIGELGEDSALGRKLEDLKLLYGAFHEYMEDRYITKEELLEVLSGMVSRSALLQNTTIALDGFTGFTPVQMRLIRELMRQCREIIVTVTVDETEDVFSGGNPYQLFALSKEMACSLAQIAREEKQEIGEPVVLPGHPVYRYQTRNEFGFLESNLFRKDQKTYQESVNSIQLYEVDHPRREVELVAGKICRLIREQGYHYREIAVVTTDIGSYANDLEEVFAAYGIPLFLDYKRNVLNNAFVEYIRSLLAMADEQFSYESVFRFLRTGLFPLAREEVDLLENYVLALGIHGFKRWQQPWIRHTKTSTVEQLDRLNHMRVQFVEALEPLMAILKRREKTAEDLTRALYAFFVQERLQEQLVRRQMLFEERNESALAREYAQMYQIVIHLLDQFVELLGAEKVSLEEYRQLLDAGFAEAKVGVIPPSMDQVVAGDLTRTRVADVRALFFLGACDRLLPGNLAASGLLTEWDREWFEGQGVKLSSTMKEKVYQQKFYLYQTLTKPTEHLCLVYSAADENGRAERPSYLLYELQHLFPKLTIQKERTQLEEMSLSSGIEYVIRGMEREEHGEEDPLWNALFGWYCGREPWAKVLDEIVKAHLYHCPQDQLTRETAKQLYGDELKGSVTRLERYAACAYAHFMDYGIRLSEREEYGFEALDFGIVLHDALEKYGQRVQESGVDWVQLPEERRRELVEACVTESMTDYGNTVLYSSARMESVRARIIRMMNRTIWAMTRQLQAGDFTPSGYEVNFGSGRIDRVDTCVEDSQVYVKVIDYKTGWKQFDMTMFYEGQQLQLLLYMREAMELAAAQNPDKDAVPAGVFYYRIQDPLVDKRASREEIERAILRELRLDGIINDDEAVLHHLDRDPGKESQAVPFGYKKNGKLTAASRIYSREDFETMMAYGGRLKTSLKEQILAGDVAIQPVSIGGQTACRYCPYAHICKIDGKVPGYQRRTIHKREDRVLLEKMKEENLG